MTHTLDPNDWSSFRTLAHEMVDDMLDHLSTIGERPAWQPMPDDVRSSFREPLPRQGDGAESAYRAFTERVLPYPNGNSHPRFWGWVQGSGVPLAVLADMLASALNPHMAGFNHAPALVEHQVIAWLAELAGFPSDASGVLVLGGTMANVLGLAVARHAKAGFDVRNEGLQSGHPRLLLYGSTETHGWAVKAAELLGLGSSSFRQVPIDDHYRIDVAQLGEAVARDRAEGHRPFCVIGTAGTVNTGAIDDLRALAKFCRDESLWFHVDGAFGALANWSDALRPLVAGIDEADSIGFDLHKWMYLPFDVACTLVRDPALHRATFAHAPSYLAETTRGVIAGGLPFADRGVDLTRGFRALKIWMTLKAYGVETFAHAIEENVRQAQHLAARVEASDELELLAPVALNVVCFRYRPSRIPLPPGEGGRRPGEGRDHADESKLNAINEEILLRIQERGIAVPSGTVLDGRYAIRVAITNHRSRIADFDQLADAVIAIGAEVREEA